MKFLYDQETNKSYVSHMTDVEFLLEKNKWKFTPLLNEAEVVPCDVDRILRNYKEVDLTEDQILLVWFVELHGDHVTPQFVREHTKPLLDFHKKTIIVHTNGLDTHDPQYIHCDVMFNRQKLFCTEYQEELCSNKLWTSGAPKITYELADINKIFLPTNKIFLFPNRILEGNSFRNDLKIKFKNFMHYINASMYHSDPLNGMILEPNGWKNNFETSHLSLKPGGTWFPIDNYYYNTSYISVTTETLLTNHFGCYPSEKYFDPLIKGNFPLIFSAAGTVENLKTLYGFKFPDWIDYSYDLIYDFDDRVIAYANSIEKVSKIPLYEIHELYLKDKHILEHNKNIFFSKPYSLLYDKILNTKQQLNW